MTDGTTTRADFGAWSVRSLGAGLALLALGGIGALFNLAAFFHAWLWAWLFWLGIALGSLAVLMLHHLTGGAWGFVIRRPLEAAATTLPLLGALFVPVLLGLHFVFPWSRAGALAGDPALQQKGHFFLDVVWFVVRAIVYFVVWCALAFALRRWSLAQDASDDPGGDPAITARFQRWCGPGLLLYVLTMSLAAIDWMMSLEPHWYSTIFGMLVICGQGLSAFAFAILVASRLVKQLGDIAAPKALHDLGNLLLAFVLLWAYMAFSQYLIIWSGNLPEESLWYVHRAHGGWQWAALCLVALHFFLPFVLLLFGGLKRRPGLLGAIAGLVLLAHALDTFWLVAPSFSPGALRVGWLDVVLPLGLGGVWLAVFLRALAAHPLVPLHDPRLAGDAEDTGKEAPAHG